MLAFYLCENELFVVSVWYRLIWLWVRSTYEYDTESFGAIS
jgi:hypothetical protein